MSDRKLRVTRGGRCITTTMNKKQNKSTPVEEHCSNREREGVFVEEDDGGKKRVETRASNARD